MQKFVFVSAVLVAASSAHAALLHLDTTYVEVFRPVYGDEAAGQYAGDINTPYSFQFDIYGSLTLTEEDRFASPVLEMANDTPVVFRFIDEPSFQAAPRATDNKDGASFVGAYTRTGKLGTIFFTVHHPDLFGYGTHALNFTTGVGRNSRNYASWEPSSADQTFTIMINQLRPQLGPPPVPEPASMAVLGVGALALLRRKRKSGLSSRNIDNP